MIVQTKEQKKLELLNFNFDITRRYQVCHLHFNFIPIYLLDGDNTSLPYKRITNINQPRVVQSYENKVPSTHYYCHQPWF